MPATPPSFAQLLSRSIVALLVCTALVWLCYAFVDRPVAYFVYGQELPRYELLGKYPILKWLTLPPVLLEVWAPAVMVLLLAGRAFGPWARGQETLFAACVSLLVVVQFKETLKLAFGRTWPDTWIDNNPSLIRDGVYGFNPFHGGEAY